MSAQKNNSPKQNPAAKPELKAEPEAYVPAVNGLRPGDTAEVVADMGRKYRGLTGKVTMTDPGVSGVVLRLADGHKEFFLGTDLKKV